MSGARLSRHIRGLDHIFYIPNGSSHQQFVHELSVMNQRSARHPLGPLSSQSDDTRAAQPPAGCFTLFADAGRSALSRGLHRPASATLHNSSIARRHLQVLVLFPVCLYVRHQDLRIAMS
jgi:hypothetical protein